MSTVSVYLRHISEPASKPQPRTTLRHDYFVIMAASSIFLGIVVISMLVSPVMITSSSGLSMDDISACRQKIIGAEQMGYYSSPDQFRLAESYCYIR
jgi:hypothetical protein